jgi:hypothetical protein
MSPVRNHQIYVVASFRRNVTTHKKRRTDGEVRLSRRDHIRAFDGGGPKQKLTSSRASGNCHDCHATRDRITFLSLSLFVLLFFDCISASNIPMDAPNCRKILVPSYKILEYISRALRKELPAIAAESDFVEAMEALSRDMYGRKSAYFVTMLEGCVDYDYRHSALINVMKRGMALCKESDQRQAVKYQRYLKDGGNKDIHPVHYEYDEYNDPADNNNNGNDDSLADCSVVVFVRRNNTHYHVIADDR